MLLKNKSLFAVFSCALMLAAAPLLPVELSIMGSAYAKDGGGGGNGGGGGGGNGGGHGGGNSGGNGGGHGGGTSGGHSGGMSGSHSDADHDGRSDSNGHGKGLASDHTGKAVRDRGVSGNRYGSDRGHGATTSGVAHSKDTRGLAKARAIATTTPGDHNTKGLSKIGNSISNKTH